MRTKQLLALGVAALFGLALSTSCTGPEAPGASSGETRTVKDATGVQVKVPTDPKRVVALSEQDLDSALAVDVKPVGTIKGRGQDGPPGYLKDKTSGIDIVGDVGKPTTDKIVELKPDLVLLGAVDDKEQIEQIRELVPATVVTYSLEDDWKTAFTSIADALNKQDEAKKWLSDYDAKTAEAADKLGDNAKKEMSIIRWNPDGPGIMQKGSFASLVIQDMGLKRPEDQQEPGYAHSEPLSLENLPRIDGDWIFAGTLDPNSKDALSEAQDDPAFSKLDAVKKDHFIEVDGTLWTSRGGPLGALLVVDNVVDTLKA